MVLRCFDFLLCFSRELGRSRRSRCSRAFVKAVNELLHTQFRWVLTGRWLIQKLEKSLSSLRSKILIICCGCLVSVVLPFCCDLSRFNCFFICCFQLHEIYEKQWLCSISWINLFLKCCSMFHELTTMNNDFCVWIYSMHNLIWFDLTHTSIWHQSEVSPCEKTIETIQKLNEKKILKPSLKIKNLFNKQKKRGVTTTFHYFNINKSYSSCSHKNKKTK